MRQTIDLRDENLRCGKGIAASHDIQPVLLMLCLEVMQYINEWLQQFGISTVVMPHVDDQCPGLLFLQKLSQVKRESSERFIRTIDDLIELKIYCLLVR